ncbi:MAG TPA: DUF1998 domain-containing protein [Caulobacteraceae bacterium]|jgi:hypothetical protein|nr:DUF1998 domain-containing protein [Caulobacteraceae bacterium]
MADNLLRQSQTVTSFGPGSMLDLPDHSVLVGGLNLWSTDTSAAGWQAVDEPRLAAMLEKKLEVTGLELRTPPAHEARRGRQGAGPFVGAVIFPLWFVCGQAGDGGQDAKRRRMVRWNDLEAPQRKTFRDGRAAMDVTPIRFVAACDRGHIQDIDWRWVVHRGDTSCVGRPLYLEEKGTSGDTSDLAVVCDCGKRFALSEAYLSGNGGASVLGLCGGHRPWLGDGNREPCTEGLKLLTRTASNAYFSQSMTVISIPPEQDRLSQMVQKHHGTLMKAPSAAIVGIYRDGNPGMAADLAGYSDEEVFRAVKSAGAERNALADAAPKEAEFAVLTSGRKVIGEDAPSSTLYAETLDRAEWDSTGRWRTLSRVVAVHRLREVIAQYGFTRFEAPARAADGSVEEHNLDVEVAPIATEHVRWLPAIEQFGEGILLQFDTGAITDWLGEDATRARALRLEEGHDLWVHGRYDGGAGPSFRGIGYYLAHSLSHALMAEIALECGYPQSSLKERIYSGESGLGLMIYTAAGDAEGTLGGLVALAPRISELLERALQASRLCSNDPLCSDHDPAQEHDDRHLQGAACHGCLLAPETSCENRNDHLDRALLVECLTDKGAPYFEVEEA